MAKLLEPLTFDPIYRDYIWGGSRIGERFRRPLASSRTAESWEISDRPDGMSQVANGLYCGWTINDLVMEFGEHLLGRNQSDQRFPLLIKIIDAKEPLSVQVHPNAEDAVILHGEPKTEMWYLLEGGPLFAGFKKPMEHQEFAQAVSKQTIMDHIRKVDAKRGDAVLIPAGRIHAIGQGCMILEVQQNSNTTYRVYDWDRVDSNGIKRPLHMDEALQCINWNDCHDPIVKGGVIEDGINFKRSMVLSTPFFTVEKLEISDFYQIQSDFNTFQIFFHISGKLQGTTWLLPAVSHPIDFHGPAEVLRIYCPNASFAIGS